MESIEAARALYQEAGRRFVLHFLAVAQMAGRNLRPGLRWARAKTRPDLIPPSSFQPFEQEAISILDYERPNLLQAIEAAHVAHERELVCQLADELAAFFYMRSYWGDWVRTAELALKDGIQTGDAGLQAKALNNLGIVCLHLERLSEAATHSQQSLAFSRQLNDRYGEALAQGNLAGVYFAQGDLQTAAEWYTAALANFESLADEYGQAQALMGLGISLARQHNFAAAAARLAACLEIQQRIGDRLGEAQTLNNLGIAQRMQGQLAEAAASYQASLMIKRELGNRQGMADTLNNLAIAYQQMAFFDLAIAAWEEAERLLQTLNPVGAQRLARRLDRARRQREQASERQ